MAAQGIEVAAHVGEGGGYLNTGLPPAGQGAGKQKPSDEQEQHGQAEKHPDFDVYGQDGIKTEKEADQGGEQQHAAGEQSGGDFDEACGLPGKVDTEDLQAQQQEVRALVDEEADVVDVVFEAHAALPLDGDSGAK